MTDAEPPIDPAALRAALGAFATGVTVVTATDASGAARAITVNSFTSVSLDPPLILYCLDRAAFNFDWFAEAATFAVNVLAAEQQEISNRFACETADDCAGLGAERLATGCLILPGALAALDCRRHAVHEAGDHLIILGRVVGLKAPGDADPLLYYRGAYAAIRR